jgi:hypothetical protein
MDALHFALLNALKFLQGLQDRPITAIVVVVIVSYIFCSYCLFLATTAE